jgi:ketosteroid isomerase-like protein
LRAEEDSMIAATLLATLTLATPQEDRAEDTRQIQAHIEEIFQAYRRRDRDTVRRTHAKDWRGFIRMSPGVVRGIDAYMREAEAILSADVEISDWKVRDFDVVYFGNTAVVSYVADFDILRDGVRTPDAIRVVDVYVKEAGSWNQTASQVATHPAILAARSREPQTLTPAERRELLVARESVWRSYFAGDAAALERALPAELVAINAGEEEWQGRAATLEGARQFRSSGGRLLRLEFPKTEIQVYGDTAILYTTYLFETEGRDGKRETSSGRGTEIFVRRDGGWVNSGWHLDSGR